MERGLRYEGIIAAMMRRGSFCAGLGEHFAILFVVARITIRSGRRWLTRICQSGRYVVVGGADGVNVRRGPRRGALTCFVRLIDGSRHSAYRRARDSAINKMVAGDRGDQRHPVGRLTTTSARPPSPSAWCAAGEAERIPARGRVPR